MNICVIGSCDLMIDCIKILKKYKINVLVVLSKRHSQTKLSNYKDYPQNILNKLNINHYICNNINSNINIINKIKKFKAERVFCFGSAWIFKKKILKLTKKTFLNFNPIPIPLYFGGAHYTWQILTKNKDSGLFVQEVSTNVDKGDILFIKKKKNFVKLNKPIDYFRLNRNFQKNAFSEFFKKFINNYKFKKNLFTKFDKYREYYPRLNTVKDALINWDWKGSDIETFCNAFDDPYPGAQSIIGKIKVGLKKVKLFKKKNIHPFLYGLIFRVYKNKIFIFCKDGYLIISEIYDKNSKKIDVNYFKEGQKFTNKIFYKNS